MIHGLLSYTGISTTLTDVTDTRFENTAKNDLALVTLAATGLSLR